MSYAGVLRQCEESLRRLQTDYIDLYQIHWPSKVIPPEETLSAMERLKREGKIREIGVCNHGVENLRALAGSRVAANQLPCSLLWRLAEGPIVEATLAAGAAVWAYSPLAQGLLTGKFRSVEEVPLGRRNTRLYSSAWGQGRFGGAGFEREVFAFLGELRTLAEGSGFSMAALSLAFLRSRPWMGSVLVGARTPDQLAQNLAAYEAPVPADLLEEVDRRSWALRGVMGENPDLWEDADGGRMR